MHLGAEAHIVRVPTDDNIADLPSRPIPRGGSNSALHGQAFQAKLQAAEAIGNESNSGTPGSSLLAGPDMGTALLEARLLPSGS